MGNVLTLTPPLTIEEAELTRRWGFWRGVLGMWGRGKPTATIFSHPRRFVLP